MQSEISTPTPMSTLMKISRNSITIKVAGSKCPARPDAFKSPFSVSPSANASLSVFARRGVSRWIAENRGAESIRFYDRPTVVTASRRRPNSGGKSGRWPPQRFEHPSFGKTSQAALAFYVSNAPQEQTPGHYRGHEA